MTSQRACGVVCHQRHGEVEREAVGEHSERAEQPLLGRPEQAVAPVERVVQRAVARRRVAVPAGEQREALRQRVVHALQAEQRHPRGRHLQRERQAVELRADRAQQGQLPSASPRSGDRPRRCVRPAAPARPLSPGTPGSRRARARPAARVAARVRRRPRAAPGSSRAVARRPAGAAAWPARRRSGSGVRRCPAPAAEPGRPRAATSCAASVVVAAGQLQVQCARQRAGHLAAVRQGCQVDPDAAAGPARCRGARQAGLADTRRADQRDAAAALQQFFETGEVVISADQPMRGGARRRGRGRRRWGHRRSLGEGAAAPPTTAVKR